MFGDFLTGFEFTKVYCQRMLLLLGCAEMTHNAKIVFCTFQMLVDKNNKVSVTQKNLSNILNQTERSIRSALKELKVYGYVMQIARGKYKIDPAYSIKAHTIEREIMMKEYNTELNSNREFLKLAIEPFMKKLDKKLDLLRDDIVTILTDRNLTHEEKNKQIEHHLKLVKN